MTLRGDPVLEAFLNASAPVSALLSASEVGARWDSPSALPGYTVGGLAAHVFLATQRIERVLDGDARDYPGAPVPVADFYGPNRLSNPEELNEGLHPVIRAGAHEVAARGSPYVAERFSDLLARIAETLPWQGPEQPVSVVNVPGGHTTLRDYLRTRVVELIVHGDDLAASTDVKFDVPASAVDVALGAFLELARTRSGDLAVVRAFARTERAIPEILRVL